MRGSRPPNPGLFAATPVERHDRPFSAGCTCGANGAVRHANQPVPSRSGPGPAGGPPSKPGFWGSGPSGCFSGPEARDPAGETRPRPNHGAQAPPISSSASESRPTGRLETRRTREETRRRMAGGAATEALERGGGGGRRRLESGPAARAPPGSRRDFRAGPPATRILQGFAPEP